MKIYNVAENWRRATRALLGGGLPLGVYNWWWGSWSFYVYIHIHTHVVQIFGKGQKDFLILSNGYSERQYFFVYLRTVRKDSCRGHITLPLTHCNGPLKILHLPKRHGKGTSKQYMGAF